jgi:hypothetical protein
MHSPRTKGKTRAAKIAADLLTAVHKNSTGLENNKQASIDPARLRLGNSRDCQTILRNAQRGIPLKCAPG